MNSNSKDKNNHQELENFLFNYPSQITYEAIYRLVYDNKNNFPVPIFYESSSNQRILKCFILFVRL